MVTAQVLNTPSRAFEICIRILVPRVKFALETLEAGDESCDLTRRLLRTNLLPAQLGQLRGHRVNLLCHLLLLVLNVPAIAMGHSYTHCRAPATAPVIRPRLGSLRSCTMLHVPGKRFQRDLDERVLDNDAYAAPHGFCEHLMRDHMLAQMTLL